MRLLCVIYIKNLNRPKILSVDLETTANQGYYWGQNFETGIIETIEYWKILSYATKWLHGKSIVRGWIDTKNEENLVKELWKLLDEADIVIAHNGKSFDIKKANTKFLEYDLGLPSPYKLIDTKIEAKKYLSLPSYSLNNICDKFGFGHKIEHEGWELWKKCIAGDKKSWDKMKRYNLHDVILLEKVYLKLRPLMTNHPNLTLWNKSHSCPKCGGTTLHRGGYYTNATTCYQVWRCADCRGQMRERLNLFSPQLTNI